MRYGDSRVESGTEAPRRERGLWRRGKRTEGATESPKKRERPVFAKSGGPSTPKRAKRPPGGKGDRLRLVRRYGGVALGVLLGIAAGGLAGEAIVSVMTERQNYPIRRVETTANQVALAVALAGNNEGLEPFLQHCKDEGAAVSFFVTGEHARQFPEDLALIEDYGYEILPMTWKLEDARKLSSDDLRGSVDNTQKQIGSRTAAPKKIFMPAYGAPDSKMALAISGMGFVTVGWEVAVSPTDFRQPVKVAESVALAAQRGSIIRMQAGDGQATGLIPELIRALRDKGLEIVPVGQLIYPDNFTVDKDGVQRMGDTTRTGGAPDGASSGAQSSGSASSASAASSGAVATGAEPTLGAPGGDAVVPKITLPERYQHPYM